MRSEKQYSNVTFTKKVDHEAGLLHTPRVATEPQVCRICSAI
jgi:hypothetical protein